MNSTSSQSIRRTLFSKSALFLELVDELIPNATTHHYSFVEDASFREWRDSANFSFAEQNHILALELLDKAHLAAITSLVRTKRWADGACLLYDAANFLRWASCARGLIESAGDIIDGLLNIAPTLAKNHRAISRCLSGDPDNVYKFAEPEAVLDHFVLAKWGRDKNSVLTAKANVDYIRLLESVAPGVVKAYQRLCSVTHPSSDSINFLFDQNTETNEGLRLEVRSDPKAITDFLSEFPTTIPTALMMSCNPPLLILRVLHKFSIHPKLPMLKKLNWSEIPAWADIERSLNR